ncbi:hypothetical protein QJS10_CPB15g01964 [Acorus calamus]|uniref:Uncharacterized protein n=1 Tax=Acorus calamus TaxID=4465 RepID=A0AAV9D4X4_ACOCL|nr:hypothetical protein QJS10_CPB15g01964 [Acorus calamus]
MGADCFGVDLDALRSWPELVGKDVKLARAMIELEDPYVHVFLVPSTSKTTLDDLRYDRVWIRYDPKTHLVTQTPYVG